MTTAEADTFLPATLGRAWIYIPRTILSSEENKTEVTR